ncbi:MAG: MOSC N-terminal beta barrel domain-containing protein [Leptolyngbyaceae cyanobacterium bins.349]|nr:MOSC N-terminal beta barrel domain-containing protein [Leptolyngbyaceae cyanobacterium bins.349]
MSDLAASVFKLWIYPLKSFDPVEVDSVTLLNSGALWGDRTFALIDATKKFVNGKRHAQIHTLRSRFDLSTNVIELQVQGVDYSAVFHVERDRAALEAWITDYLGFSVQLIENTEMGFPDDTESPGATVVSTATLEAIASWYPDLTVDEIRRRFRANIELSGVPAFWEDQLFAEPSQAVHFQIGTVRFIGVNPCQRCVVVTRDSLTGVTNTEFQKTFVEKRRETLPNWVARSRFNHFFRLAVNTRVPASEAGKTICLGDMVKIL